MSLYVCMSCGTAYAPAALCPHCGYDSFRYSWEEEPEPKPAAKAKTPVSRPRLADASEDED